MDQVLTTKEAAEYLKINPQVMERFLRQKKVPGRKVGNQWRISKLALDLWLAPSLASTLPAISQWQSLFYQGDQINRQLQLSDQEIQAQVDQLRKDKGLQSS